MGSHNANPSGQDAPSSFIIRHRCAGSPLFPFSPPVPPVPTADSKRITLKPDPGGGKGLGAGVVPLGHPDLLSNRPVNALAFSSSSSGEPLLLAAYGPVGAQLGAAELLKV